MSSFSGWLSNLGGRSQIVLRAAVAALVALALHEARAATIYWDGTSATWSTLSAWSTGSAATTPNPSAVPGLADDVIFNITTANNASSTITLGSTNQAARSLTFNTSGSSTLLAGGTARTLTLGIGGITLSSTAGAVRLGDGSAGNNVLISLGAGGQTWTNNSANAFTINNTAATFTRATGATLTFNQASTGVFAMSTTVAPTVNGILGPWAFFGTGANTRFATNTTGTIAGLVGTAAANATNLTDTTGVVNYDLVSGTGAIGAANFSANTIRYTGGAATTAPGATSFSVNGLLNAGSGLWTIGTNPITIGSTKELVVNTANNGITITSAIGDNAGGASSLTVVGSNTTTLSGSNSFTGGLTLGRGSLTLNNANAAGSGTIALVGNGVLNINPGITVANPIRMDIDADRTTITAVGGGNSGLSGGITFTGTAGLFPTINANGSGTFTISGGLTGTSFTGSPSLRGSGTGVLNGAVNIPNGGLDLNGSATWTLNTAGSNYPNFSWQGNSGNVILGVSDALATNALISVNVAATGFLNMNGFNQSLPGIAFGSGTAGFSIINNSASTDSTLTFSGLTVDRSFSGAIKDGPTRKISLVMNSAGRAQILNGTSTYSGTTSITAGTLRAGAAAGGQAFGNLSAVALANTSGATLDLNGFNQTVGSLAGGGASGGNVTLGTGTLTTGGNNTSTSYAGVISGSGGLTKAGTGVLTLSAANTFSGATTISAGQLQILAGNINASSGITVNGATAEFKYNSATALNKPLTLTQGTLSGTGSIGTAVSVGSAAILSPGNSPGSQSFTQGLTFAQGGQYTWEINNWAGAAGTGYDQLVVSGSALNITATSGSTFKILVTSLTGSNTAGAVPGFVGTTGTSFTIATSSPAMTGFDKSKFTIDSTTAFGNVNTLPTNAGFWLSTNGGSTSLILNYAPSATYNLSAAASATAIRVGGTSTITATVTSSTAALTNPDTMSYTGLALSGGVGVVSSTSGTLAPGSAGSGNVAFTPVGSGSFTFNPSVTTATNVNLATSANAGTTSGVTVTVWNPAAATTSGSVNLGSVIVGSTSAWTQALSVTNSAPNDGFSESLNASFGSLSGVTTNSGSFNLLAAGSTNNAALTVSLATGSVGNQAGSAQILFATDGQGSSGLGTEALAPQTVNVYGTVLDHALPGFVGTGITDPYAQTTLNLDFGSVDESAGTQTLTYSLTNLASLLYGSGLTAGLDLTAFTPDGGGFASGLSTFNDLTASGTSSLFTASFTPGGQGTFSKVFTLSFSDNRNLAGATSVRSLTINAQVIVVPEPGAIALAGIGFGLAGLMAWKRRPARAA